MRRLVLVVLLLMLWAPAAKAWTWPVQGPVLLGFTFDSAHPYAGGQHRGIDIGAGTGTAVVAPAGGVVTFAGTVPASGKSVTIATPDGYSVTLTHLGSIGVSKGAAVGEGDAVGTVGPSGTPELNVPYLYMGVRTTADAQGYLDPLSFLPALPPPTVSAPTPPPPAGATTAAPPAAQTTGDAASDGSDAAAPPSAAETGGDAGSDGATAPVQAPDSSPAPDVPTAPAPADAGDASPTDKSATDVSAGAGDGTAASAVPDAAAAGSPPDAPAGAGDATAEPGSTSDTAVSASAPDPGAGDTAGTGGTPAADASPPPAPPSPRPSAPAAAPAAPSPPAIVVTPVVEDVPIDAVEPEPAAAAPDAASAPAASPAPAAPAPAAVWVDDALVVRAGPLGTLVALVPALPRAVPRPSRVAPDPRRASSQPAPRAEHPPATVERPGHRRLHAAARSIAPSQRQRRRAAPALARPPHRSGLPVSVLVLLCLAALAVVAVVVGGVRMISSPSQPEGERSDAAEDPRRGRVAVCERPEAPRPCRRPRRAVGHLRALPPAARQRRPDGERDGRARHAGHGLRRSRRRVSA